MTGRMLYSQLQNFGDLDAPEASVISWIDMAQKKASLDIPVVLSITATDVTVGTNVQTPNGVFKVISAKDGTGKDYPLSSIIVSSNHLTLMGPADSVVITYSGIAPDYRNLDDELTIHPSLHSPLVYYLISMYYDMEGEGDSEESSLAERFYQRWVYYRNLAIAALMGTDNDTYTREPVPTIDVLRHNKRKAYGGGYYE